VPDPAYAHPVARLRAILLLRSGLALFLLGLGVYLLLDGDPVFGAIALAAGVVNVVLVLALARRARPT
jgi:hypothetical protein